MSSRLQNEKSPYLLEHAENPVDWYPWGAEAFEKAAAEDKPIFLSIGYASDHWCHVMNDESFDNPVAAVLLNRYFVPIIVDREERPDIDSVYMSACAMLNGSGGWPLTVIMTPEQKPFFAATYIPLENALNRMGLKSLLTAVADKWKNDRGALLRTAEDISVNLRRSAKADGSAPDGEFLKNAAEQLKASNDKEYGGFGSSPKFPSPQNLIFLMRYAALSGDKSCREIADAALKTMYRGGIYDHFGGGFFRYSTDREWLAPHFEKMLHVNAALAYAYTEAWQSGRLALYRTVAENTLDMCMRDLLSDGGGYFCALDADSGDNVEGAYYLFTPDEVEKALGSEDGKHFCECYDINAEGNFRGKCIPNLLINTRWQLLPEGYDELCEKMRIFRASRMPLKTDTTQLLSWNGLMLMTLAKAASAFGDARYLYAAESLAEFIKKSFYENGKLKARRIDGELKYDARLDDYVFYALGLLELFNADRKAEHLCASAALADEIERRFASNEGFFYMNGDGGEKLIIRPREISDGEIPSGNSGAAMLFDLLGRYTGSKKYRDVSAKTLRYIAGVSGKYYAASPFALCAALSGVYPTKEILLALPDENIPESFRAVTSGYAPDLTVTVKTPAQSAKLTQVAPFSASCGCKDGKPTIYVCQNGAYSEPIVM
jgi:uncharacterized protein